MITKEDFGENLIKVLSLNIQAQTKDDKEILICKCEKDGKVATIGVIGEKPIKSFLAHGTKNKDGRIEIEIPASKFDPTKSIEWINAEY